MTKHKSEKQTKILFFITKGNWGGAQRYVFDLATNLPKDKYQVIILCGQGVELPAKLKQAKINVIQINHLKKNINPLTDLKAVKDIWLTIKQEKPDILHLNSSKAGIIGSISGRFLGIKKIIFTGHGWAFNEKRNIFSRTIIYCLHWLTVILSHKTIAVSKETARQINLLPIGKNKIKVIKNGVQNFESLNTKEARKALAGYTKLLSQIPPNNLIWLGAVGELNKNKGFDIAIKAMQKINQVHPESILVIIGEGEERKNLEKLIEKTELRETVFLIGKVPEARKYLKAFDVFLIPSRTEALPYVALEAGLSGLPVITTNTGGLPEIIDTERSGLIVEKENPEDLVKAIEKLLENKTLITRYGLNLQEKIEKEFTLEQMIIQTEKIYQN